MRNTACAALIVLLASSASAYGQAAANNPYPTMAPDSQYLMPRAAEIEMARSAGPASISDNAEVLVLTKTDYVVAAKGSNGWVCLVGRMWSAGLDDPEFWNPKGRGAGCLNPAAVESVLPFYIARAKWAWPVTRAKRSQRSPRPATPHHHSPTRRQRRSHSCSRRRATSTMESRARGVRTSCRSSPTINWPPGARASRDRRSSHRRRRHFAV